MSFASFTPSKIFGTAGVARCLRLRTASKPSSTNGEVSCRWIDILKQGHAIAQVTRIDWTSPGNRHKDVRVGGARRPWSGRAVAAARKDCNVIANVGEINGNAVQHVGLLTGQSLRLDQKVDHVERGVSRYQANVLREVGERSNLLATKIGIENRHLALWLKRKA